MNVIKISFSDNEFMILTIHSILKVEVFHFIVVQIEILALVLEASELRALFCYGGQCLGYSFISS